MELPAFDKPPSGAGVGLLPKTPGKGRGFARPFLRRRARLGLVWQFAIAFSAMTLVVGTFLYAVVRNYSEDNIRTSSLALMSMARSAVFNRVESDFEVAESVVKYNAALARHGKLPLEEEQRLSRIFLEQILLQPKIHALSFSNEQGGIAGGWTQSGTYRLIYTKGMKQGLRTIEHVDSAGGFLARLPPPRMRDFDPRERPWYVSAKKRRGLIWESPLIGTVNFHLTFVAAYPLIGPSGEIQGVFTGDVTLDSTGAYLESNRSSPNAHLMLLEPDGTLIANSSRAPLLSVVDGKATRLKAETVPHPLAREAANLVGKAHASRTGTFSTFLQDDKGRAYYLDIAPFVHGQDIRWYLVSVVPRSDFAGPLDALWSRFLFILLGGAVGAVGLSFVMAGWVTRPMRAINDQVKEIAIGRFGSRVETRRRDEIGQLAQSFNDMSGRLAATYEELRGKHAALDAANRDLAALLELERVRRMEAEAEGRRAHVLGEAIAAMSDTRDHERLHRALPRALVRSYVDWALVEVAAPGGTTLTEGAHCEADKESLLQDLIGKYPPRMTRAAPGADALESGEPLHLPVISDEQIRTWCADELHAEGVRRLGARSAIIVPLIARQKRVGVLALVSATAERFGPADVRLAAELGGRAAMALDSARLYADLQIENAVRRQAEAERRKTEELLHGILEKIPAQIFVKDLEGRYLLVNRHMADVIGRDAASLLGKTASEVYSPEQAQALAAFDRRVLEAGEALEGEEEMPGAEGVRTYIQIEAPLSDAGGRVYALCGISTDITARKRAEEALRRSEEDLRQAQKMEAIGNLAGGIAHDFNNLLSIIIGYSGLLLPSMGPDDKRREKVREIDRAAMRAAALTQQLLAFGRKQLLQPRVIDLGGVVAGVESMLRRLIGEDIGLTVRGSRELGCVRADPNRMEQIIMNLAVNARDAMPRGGRLSIETANADLDPIHAAQAGVAPGPYVMLAVADTGVGMDRATLARIFEPFFTTKEVGKGTGLGLATVFGIVQQSGGGIKVDSEPGRGTTFSVYLPRTAATGEFEREHAYPVSDTLEGSETILLVEDEPEVRTLVNAILQHYGYRVIEAQTGGDALLLSEEHPGPIDLLLTDVIMPHINGPQLARRLGRLVRKVLYMSGYTEDSMVRQGLLDSSVALLEKPITPEGLGRKVREVLDSPPEAYRPPVPEE